jgi:NAD(P)-dependent dehydrogenase (short-subunit alcohol dehydrogenase family)
MTNPNAAQTVVITGASAGLGRAIAHSFAKHGARIGLIARNPEALKATREEVEHRGGQALLLPLDVADDAEVENAAARVEQEFGPIDVWINNAMVSVFSPIKQMEAEEYRRVTEVTYLGYVYGTLAALRRMLPRDRGTIIQVGSALAYRSIPLQSAYCAAKHAIVGFTDSLRCELFHDRSNVKVTIVQMPAMNTMQFDWVKSRLPRKPQPVPPIHEPEVAAKTVWRAAQASHPRREYWVGFPTVQAIVGQRIIPGVLDRYLGSTGYDAQQYDGSADPSRPNNLWTYVPGRHRTHGDFEQRAQQHSTQVWLDFNPNWIAAGAVALGVLAGIAGSRKLRKKARSILRAA